MLVLGREAEAEVAAAKPDDGARGGREARCEYDGCWAAEGELEWADTEFECEYDWE